MRIFFFSTCGAKWGGSEVLWCKAAKSALLKGYEVGFSVFGHDELADPIQELLSLGGKAYFRKPFIPSLSARLVKRFRRDVLHQDATHYDFVEEFRADHVHFSLAAGQEPVIDRDLYRLIQKLSSSFSFYCHELWVSSEDQEVLGRLKGVLERGAFVGFTSRYASSVLDVANSTIFSQPLSIGSAPHRRIDTVNARAAMIGTIDFGRKGQDIGLSAWRLSKAFPGGGLVVSGSGKDCESLLEMVGKNRLSREVRIMNPASDLATFFQSAELCLFPSRSDSGPITLVEAMMAGCVVVCSPIGLASDMIVDGVNGFIATEMSLESFSESIDRAIERKDDWEKITRNAQYSAKLYSELDPVEEFLKVIFEARKGQE